MEDVQMELDLLARDTIYIFKDLCFDQERRPDEGESEVV